MSEEKKLTEEELKQAFFILRHGSSEGLSEYIKAVLAIENEYNRQKAEIERLKKQVTQSVKDMKLEVSIRDRENTELQKQVDELKDELEKAYEIERANIRAEIADAGTSCHWCERQTVQDTAKELLQGLEERKERVKAFYGTAESVGVDIAIRAIKEICKQKGVEVE